MTHKEGKPMSQQQTNQVQESIVRIDLLTFFFQANPHTVDTVEGLARRLHRLPAEIRPALDFYPGLEFCKGRTMVAYIFIV